MRAYLLPAVFLVALAGFYIVLERQSQPPEVPTPDASAQPRSQPAPSTGERQLPSTRGRVLFLTTSAGYTHEVVKRPAPDRLSLAERELTALLAKHLDVDCTQDPADITAERLARYDVVAFYTTGELAISPEGKQALLDYVRDGGGFAGIHPATDTFYTWPAYGDLIGGRFDQHPWHQRVRVRRESRHAASTTSLGDAFEIVDEIYQFKDWRRDDVHVLLSLDVGSVDLARPNVHRDDGDFALSWWRPFGAGRVFYTALGHRPEVWKDERFRNHVRLGVLDVARGRRGRAEPDADGYVPSGRGNSDLQWVGVDRGSEVPELWYTPRESWRDIALRASVRRSPAGPSPVLYFRLGNVGSRPDGITRAVAVDLGALPLSAEGRWEDLEVTLVDRQLTVRLGGREVMRQTTSGRRVGHLGLSGPTASVRKLRTKRLPDGSS